MNLCGYLVAKKLDIIEGRWQQISVALKAIRLTDSLENDRFKLQHNKIGGKIIQFSRHQLTNVNGSVQSLYLGVCQMVFKLNVIITHHTPTQRYRFIFDLNHFSEHTHNNIYRHISISNHFFVSVRLSHLTTDWPQPTIMNQNICIMCISFSDAFWPLYFRIMIVILTKVSCTFGCCPRMIWVLLDTNEFKSDAIHGIQTKAPYVDIWLALSIILLKPKWWVYYSKILLPDNFDHEFYYTSNAVVSKSYLSFLAFFMFQSCFALNRIHLWLVVVIVKTFAIINSVSLCSWGILMLFQYFGFLVGAGN